MLNIFRARQFSLTHQQNERTWISLGAGLPRILHVPILFLALPRIFYFYYYYASLPDFPEQKNN